MDKVGFGAYPYPSRKLVDDEETFEIRVLSISSFSVDNLEINCKFDIRKFDKHQTVDTSIKAYNALSYTWGNEPASRSIAVQGVPYLPTKNLYDFLCNICATTADEAGVEIVIWIDAICINQNDEQEKLEQISVMRNVYQNAESTLIWLGCTDDDCARGLAMVPKLCALANDIYDILERRDRDALLDDKEAKWRLIANFFQDVQTNSINTATLRCWSQDRLTSIDNPTDRKPLERFYDKVADLYKADGNLKSTKTYNAAEKYRQQLFHDVLKEYDIDMSHMNWILKLLNQSWFQRVWVVQELATSKTPMVTYGQEIVLWDEFVLAVRLFNCLDSANEKAFETRYGHQRSYYVVTMDNQRDDFQKGKRPEIFDLVQLFRPLAATKPEDKIIGLQGLASKPIKPDYSIGPARFYIDFTYSVMQTSSSLNVLQAVECRHDEIDGGLIDLPSWVPDWSRSLQSVKMNSQFASKPRFDVTRFCASADSHQDRLQLVEGRKLQLDVCFVDTISSVRHHPSYLLDYRSDKGWDYELRATKKDKIPLGQRLYKTNEAIIDGLKFHAGCQSRILLLLYNFRLLRPFLPIKDYPTGENQFDAYYNLVVPWKDSNISPTFTKVFALGRCYMFVLAPLMSLIVNPFGWHLKFMWIVLIAWTVSLCITAYLATLLYGAILKRICRWSNNTVGRLVPLLYIETNRVSFSADTFWWQLAQKYLPIEPQSPQHFSLIEGLRMYNRDLRHERLARTQRGYSGYVNCSAEAGDALVVIPGADVPFIIRKMDNQGWNLIGRAHVHGFMYGEGLVGRKLESIVLG